MRNRFGLALAAILLIAIVVRVYPLPVESIDGDELFSRRAVTTTWTEGYRIVRADIVHPPLYYVALKGMVAMAGADIVGLRLTSLVAGLVTIAAVFAMGWAIPYLRGPAAVGALLIAVNDLHAFYSQQARSFSLYCALVALLVLWACLLERYGGRLAYWVAGAALMSAVVHTHFFGVLFIGCVLIPLWVAKLPARTKLAAAGAAMAAAISFLPWLAVVYGAVREKGKLDNTAWEPLPVPYILRATTGRYMGIPDIPAGTSMVILLGLALGVVGIVRARKHVEGRVLAILGLVAVGPLAILYVLGQPPFELHVFGDRHLLPTVLAWPVLAAMGVWGLAGGRRMAMVAGTVVLLAVQLTPLRRYWMQPHRHPFHQVAATVGGAGVPVYTTWPYGIGSAVNFYLPEARQVTPLPEDAGKLPGEFIVLHRPNAPLEQARLKAAVGPEYAREDGGYFSSVMNQEWGTRISRFRRR